MEEETLAKSHSAFTGDLSQWRFGVLVGVIEEMPSALGAPGEDTVVWTALVTLVEIARGNMVAGNVRMLELIQPFSRE